MPVRSGWREIALDLDGDGVADVSFSSDSVGRKIDMMAVDLDGSGEYNLYLQDFDHNGIPDTILVFDDGGSPRSSTRSTAAAPPSWISSRTRRRSRADSTTRELTLRMS